jgi:hypothetical protein
MNIIEEQMSCIDYEIIDNIVNVDLSVSTYIFMIRVIDRTLLFPVNILYGFENLHNEI